MEAHQLQYGRCWRRSTYARRATIKREMVKHMSGTGLSMLVKFTICNVAKHGRPLIMFCARMMCREQQATQTAGSSKKAYQIDDHIQFALEGARTEGK